MRVALLCFVVVTVLTGCTASSQTTDIPEARDTSLDYTGTMLTPLEHKVLWESGTERAFQNAYHDEKREGLYVTRGCGIPVFTSHTKYDSKTGWPSFWQPLAQDAIVLSTDHVLGYPRTEVKSSCGEHLGHVFPDGPEPTGKRYCINSAALVFIPLEELTPEQRALYDADVQSTATVPGGAN